MSDGHDHDHDHDGADEHHDHGFDGEPAKELSPGEPPTPGWLPLVGAAVFVAGAVYFLAQGDTSPPKTEPTRGAAPITVQTVAQPQPRPVQPAVPPARAVPAPAQGGTAAPLRQLSPDQIKDLQKRVQEARDKQQGGGAK